MKKDWVINNVEQDRYYRDMFEYMAYVPPMITLGPGPLSNYKGEDVDTHKQYIDRGTLISEIVTDSINPDGIRRSGLKKGWKQELCQKNWKVCQCLVNLVMELFFGVSLKKD